MERSLLHEEQAAYYMEAEDEVFHVELGCRVTHDSLRENFPLGGHLPLREITFRAEVATSPVCPRCHRHALGWLLQPGRNRCAPGTWAYCIRDPEVVRRQIAGKAA